MNEILFCVNLPFPDAGFSKGVTAFLQVICASLKQGTGIVHEAARRVVVSPNVLGRWVWEVVRDVGVAAPLRLYFSSYKVILVCVAAIYVCV